MLKRWPPTRPLRVAQTASFTESRLDGSALYSYVDCWMTYTRPHPSPRAQTRPDASPADTRRACCHVLSSFQRTDRVFRTFRSRDPPESTLRIPRQPPRGLFLRNLPILSNRRRTVKHFHASLCDFVSAGFRGRFADEPAKHLGRKAVPHVGRAWHRMTNLPILRTPTYRVNTFLSQLLFFSEAPQSRPALTGYETDQVSTSDPTRGAGRRRRLAASLWNIRDRRAVVKRATRKGRLRGFFGSRPGSRPGSGLDTDTAATPNAAAAGRPGRAVPTPRSLRYIFNDVTAMIILPSFSLTSPVASTVCPACGTSLAFMFAAYSPVIV
jgi:hypothetical protein